MHQNRMIDTDAPRRVMHIGGPLDGSVFTEVPEARNHTPVWLRWPVSIENSRKPFGDASGYVLGPDGNYHWRDKMGEAIRSAYVRRGAEG